MVCLFTVILLLASLGSLVIACARPPLPFLLLPLPSRPLRALALCPFAPPCGTEVSCAHVDRPYLPPGRVLRTTHPPVRQLAPRLTSQISLAVMMTCNRREFLEQRAVTEEEGEQVCLSVSHLLDKLGTHRLLSLLVLAFRMPGNGISTPACARTSSFGLISLWGVYTAREMADDM